MSIESFSENLWGGLAAPATDSGGSSSSNLPGGAHVADTEDRTDSVECSTCGGRRWVGQAEHTCGGDEGLCNMVCPEYVQVPCPDCRESEQSASEDEPF